MTSSKHIIGATSITAPCVVLTRLVQLFYANLEVVQNDDNGIVLQSTIDGHLIMVDPQVISQIIGVPVLQISVSPYNGVVLPPSLDELLGLLLGGAI
jgi:hypothetical protein